MIMVINIADTHGNSSTMIFLVIKNIRFKKFKICFLNLNLVIV